MVRPRSPQILDFGLRRKAVRKMIQSESLSVNNLRSKIQNLKSVGIFAIALMFVLVGTRAEAQQPKKVHRIGYLSSFDQASESARSEGIRLALQRAWLHRRTEYRDRVPLCGGQARSFP